MTPGRKFSSTTWLRRISSRRISTARGWRRSSEMLRLPQFCCVKYVAMELTRGNE